MDYQLPSRDLAGLDSGLRHQILIAYMQQWTQVRMVAFIEVIMQVKAGSEFKQITGIGEEPVILRRSKLIRKMPTSFTVPTWLHGNQRMEEKAGRHFVVHREEMITIASGF